MEKEIMKWHISANGEINPCQAKGKCRLTPACCHFATKVQAQRFADRLNGLTHTHFYQTVRIGTGEDKQVTYLTPKQIRYLPTVDLFILQQELNKKYNQKEQERIEEEFRQAVEGCQENQERYLQMSTPDEMSYQIARRVDEEIIALEVPIALVLETKTMGKVAFWSYREPSTGKLVYKEDRPSSSTDYSSRLAQDKVRVLREQGEVTDEDVAQVDNGVARLEQLASETVKIQKRVEKQVKKEIESLRQEYEAREDKVKELRATYDNMKEQCFLLSLVHQELQIRSEETEKIGKAIIGRQADGNYLIENE